MIWFILKFLKCNFSKNRSFDWGKYNKVGNFFSTFGLKWINFYIGQILKVKEKPRPFEQEKMRKWSQWIRNKILS